LKTAGVVRKVDQLGRIVLPKALRKRYQLNEGELVEILVQGDKIFLEKYHPKCVVCGNQAEHPFKDRYLCEDCMTGMAHLKA
jgi:AbrB family transcriptional regulator, transcriptional pleiotropic regulator of transition state genes